MFQWSRRVENGCPHYEVSTKGDKRFSSLVATLSDGRTIEEAYQLDVKGYREISPEWRSAKGKPPLTYLDKEELWLEYKKLWKQFFVENPHLLQCIREEAKNKTITDMFATSTINQAHAICDILNETPPALAVDIE